MSDDCRALLSRYLRASEELKTYVGVGREPMPAEPVVPEPLRAEWMYTLDRLKENVALAKAAYEECKASHRARG